MGNFGISIVAASLNALCLQVRDHCTVCYELYSVMKEVGNENNENNEN
jgi:hypothetical protein